MLKLLIAEDEELTRDGLTSLIDWESLGVRVSGVAANGLEALRLLEAEPADLLLTDIRMPLVDGLQLIGHIRERGLDTECVLLSGYGDFQYAQRAMRLGVTEFLVKPCSPDEIKRVFRDIAAKRTEERRLSEEVRGLERQLHVNLPHAKTQLYRQWLSGPALPAENRREQHRHAGMPIAFEHVIVMALRLDGKSLESLNYTQADAHLLAVAASNVVQETLEHGLLQPVEVVMENGALIVITNGLFEWLGVKLQESLDAVQSNLSAYLKVTASIGVSGAHADLDRLHAAYGEALEALEQRFFHGPGSCHYYEKLRALGTPSLPVHINSVQLLKLEQSALEHLRSGLFAEMLGDAEQWLTVFTADYPHSRKQINDRALSFLGRLIQAVPQQPADDAGWLRSFEQLRERMTDLETLEDLTGFVYRTIRQIVERVNPQKTPKRKVQQAIDFIELHYNEHGLSLAGVAKALFVSSTYLSTLFKQELGVNFLDYVHQYRIDKAKALLQAGDRKIQSVAREVGYYDEAHFTKTFKKWTGLLPSQYKRETSG
ncbi:response regulator [Paenibacillus xanthanilyticus]|uniref:Response regulator n=1 Tax=Paenibacillus xanthanilyticus TaxID=1783531 RepID=A0ABV8JZ25_9BACL